LHEARSTMSDSERDSAWRRWEGGTNMPAIAHAAFIDGWRLGREALQREHEHRLATVARMNAYHRMVQEAVLTGTAEQALWTDSTGKPLRVGDTVRYNGELRRIDTLGGPPNSAGVATLWLVGIDDPVAETSVDLVAPCTCETPNPSPIGCLSCGGWLR
jgi:hypothetical protein